jgi:hypothetical protein
MRSTFDKYPTHSTATEQKQSSATMSSTEIAQTTNADELEQTAASGSLHGKLDHDIDEYCKLDLANELDELPPVMLSRMVEHIVTEGQRLVAQITNPNRRHDLEVFANTPNMADAATTEIILSSGAAWDISKDSTLYTGILEAISTIHDQSQRSFLYEALGSAMTDGSSFVGNYSHAANKRFQSRVMSEEDTQKEILDHNTLSKLDAELDNAVANTAYTAISWQNRPELHTESDSKSPNDLDESLELYVGRAVRTSLVGKDEAHISPIKGATVQENDTAHYPMLHLVDDVHQEKAESKTSAPEANHDVIMTKSGPTTRFSKFVVSSLASRLSRSRN